jgi:thioester reductase-like protein
VKGVFFTGAGGFIGRYILRHYLDEPDCEIYLLENGRFRERLERFLDTAVSDPARRRRVKVLAGDICSPGLGLDASMTRELGDRVTHAIHLAALYNLSAPRDVSMRVNVDGTRNVLDFLGGMRSLQRLGYTSTTAVVGTHTGTFGEDELDVGQGFKNAYEETKFLAERLIRERRDEIPTVIFRPTTVVGHSRTGAIEKIDGPYYALTMIARNMHRVVPDTGDTKFQFAPVDFITDAFYHLFEDDRSVGSVFHLVDPQPLSYLEFFELACKAMGKPAPRLRLPARLLRRMGSLPLFERLTGVPPEAFEHSFYSIRYDTTQVAPALARHGISCPPVASYIDVMVDYFVTHCDDARIRKGDWRATTT